MAKGDNRPDDIVPRDNATGGLGARAVRGAMMSGAAQGVKLTVQIASVVVLSRFLSPRDFGLVAMASPLIAFASMAQNLGLSQAVVVSRELTYRQASTMFWINAALSFALMLILMLCSPLAAVFYNANELTPIVAALAVAIFTTGLGAQHLAMATRMMRFGGLALVDMATAVVGLAAAIAWAWFDPSPWALVASALASALASVVGAWMVSGWRPGRPANIRSVWTMLRFGGGLTTFNLTNFFARNLDNILIGRFHGAGPLGLYDRAYKLLLFPLQQITWPLQRVMVPTLSRLVDEPERYRSAYSRTVGQILLLTLPGILCLLIWADVAIPLMLGAQWSGAVDIFRWLALASLHQPLTVTLGWLFISQSRTGQFGRWGIFNAASCAVAFTAGLPWGAEGVAAAYALSDIFIRLPLVWRLAGSRGPVSARDLIHLALPFVLAGSVAGAAMFAVGALLPRTLIGLLLAVTLGYLTYGAVLMTRPLGRRTLGETLTLLRGIVSRRTAQQPVQPSA